MDDHCRCGSLIRHSFERLGCIECGAACCPACAFPLESATYCLRCAEALLGLPGGVAHLAPRIETV